MNKIALFLMFVLVTGCGDQDPMLTLLPEAPESTITPSTGEPITPSGSGPGCDKFLIPSLVEGEPATQEACSKQVTQSLIEEDRVQAGEPAPFTFRITADPQGQVLLAGLIVRVQITQPPILQNEVDAPEVYMSVTHDTGGAWFGNVTPYRTEDFESTYVWSNLEEEVSSNENGQFDGVGLTGGWPIEPGESHEFTAYWHGTHLVTPGSKVIMSIQSVIWVDERTGERVHEPLIEPLPSTAVHVSRPPGSTTLDGVSLFFNEDMGAPILQYGSWSNTLPMFHVVSYGRDRILMRVMVRIKDDDNVINMASIGYNDRHNVAVSHAAWPDTSGSAEIGFNNPMEVLLPMDVPVPLWTGASIHEDTVGSQVQFTLDACELTFLAIDPDSGETTTETDVHQFVTGPLLTIMP